CRPEPLEDVLFDAPGHRADEALGRRRRVRHAHTQELGDEGRIVRDPVPHHDPPARSGYSDDFLRDVEWPGREHRAEDRDDEVKAVVPEVFQVGRVAPLEAEVGEAELLGPRVSRRDEILCDVDAEDVRAKLRLGDRRRAVAATEIEDVEARRYSQGGHERLTAVAHRCGYPREVPLLPKRLVRVHGRLGLGAHYFSSFRIYLTRSSLTAEGNTKTGVRPAARHAEARRGSRPRPAAA